MRCLFACCFLFASVAATAQTGIFGSVHGIVHDTQHRPIANAKVVLRAGHSALSFKAQSNPEGTFSIASVPSETTSSSSQIPASLTLLRPSLSPATPRPCFTASYPLLQSRNL